MNRTKQNYTTALQLQPMEFYDDDEYLDDDYDYHPYHYNDYLDDDHDDHEHEEDMEEDNIIPINKTRIQPSLPSFIEETIDDSKPRPKWTILRLGPGMNVIMEDYIEPILTQDDSSITTATLVPESIPSDEQIKKDSPWKKIDLPPPAPLDLQPSDTPPYRALPIRNMTPQRPSRASRPPRHRNDRNDRNDRMQRIPPPQVSLLNSSPTPPSLYRVSPTMINNNNKSQHNHRNQNHHASGGGGNSNSNGSGTIGPEDTSSIKLCKYADDCRMNKNGRCSMIHSLDQWKPRECRANQRCQKGDGCDYYHTNTPISQYLAMMMKKKDSIYWKNASLYQKYLG